MNIINLLSLGESGVYYAFKHSDGVGQGIVAILCVFSVVVWCLMLIKGMSLSGAYKDSRRLLGELRKKANPLALKAMMDKEETPLARVFQAGYTRMAQLYGGDDKLYRRKPLTESELRVVRSAMEESVSDQIVVLEDKIILLMTAVSISPFLGLFGTVWGIMLAFTEMAQAGKPDISTLAPGISGALLTTVLGLVVAIPSLVGYNYITFYIKQITVFMDNFVEETLSKFEMERVIQERKADELDFSSGAERPSFQSRRPMGQQPVQQQVQQTFQQPVQQQVQQTFQQPVQQQVQQQVQQTFRQPEEENVPVQPSLPQQPPKQDPRNNRFF